MTNHQPESEDETFAWRWTKRVTAVGMAIIIFFVGVFFLWKLVTPQLNLYKAQTERRAVIAEQKANSEAAEYAARSTVTQAIAKAEAEVERAKGLAKAQHIISQTLTESYLRYLYIQTLDGDQHQVIYIPTEAGLPILEADRLSHEPAPTPSTTP